MEFVRASDLLTPWNAVRSLRLVHSNTRIVSSLESILSQIAVLDNVLGESGGSGSHFVPLAGLIHDQSSLLESLRTVRDRLTEVATHNSSSELLGKDIAGELRRCIDDIESALAESILPRVFIPLSNESWLEPLQLQSFVTGTDSFDLPDAWTDYLLPSGASLELGHAVDSFNVGLFRQSAVSALNAVESTLRFVALRMRGFEALFAHSNSGERKGPLTWGGLTERNVLGDMLDTIEDCQELLYDLRTSHRNQLMHGRGHLSYRDSEETKAVVEGCIRAIRMVVFDEKERRDESGKVSVRLGIKPRLVIPRYPSFESLLGTAVCTHSPLWPVLDLKNSVVIDDDSSDMVLFRDQPAPQVSSGCSLARLEEVLEFAGIDAAMLSQIYETLDKPEHAMLQDNCTKLFHLDTSDLTEEMAESDLDETFADKPTVNWQTNLSRAWEMLEPIVQPALFDGPPQR